MLYEPGPGVELREGLSVPGAKRRELPKPKAAEERFSELTCEPRHVSTKPAASARVEDAVLSDDRSAVLSGERAADEAVLIERLRGASPKRICVPKPKPWVLFFVDSICGRGAWSGGWQQTWPPGQAGVASRARAPCGYECE